MIEPQTALSALGVIVTAGLWLKLGALGAAQADMRERIARIETHMMKPFGKES